MSEELVLTAGTVLHVEFGRCRDSLLQRPGSLLIFILKLKLLRNQDFQHYYFGGPENRD